MPIALNRSRRADYRQRGGRRAALLSRALVAAERSLLPSARVLDRWAARFAPLPILAAELSPMSAAPDALRPLPAPGHAHDGGTDRLGRLVARLRERERKTGRHLALAVHVAESARLMHLRGADYARQSGGATRHLTRALVAGHLALLPFALALDRLAAPVHARGVGIFVNDVPAVGGEEKRRGGDEVWERPLR